MTVDVVQAELERVRNRVLLDDENDLASRIRDQGRRLVFLLTGLVRTSRLHAVDNAVFETPTHEFVSLLDSFLELLGAVHIVCVEDQVYINDVRIRARQKEHETIESLGQELARHGVGGITFYGSMAPGAVRTLAAAIAGSAPRVEARAALERRLSEFPDIELAGPFRLRVGAAPDPTAEKHHTAIRKGIGVVKATSRKALSSKLVNPVVVRRIVIELIESIHAKPEIAAAEPLRNRKLTPEEQHVLSTCSLAILLGQAIELSLSRLSDLGVVAIMHDLGTTWAGSDEKHVVDSARLFMKQRGFHEAKIRRILTVLEHHLPYQLQDDHLIQLDRSIRHPSLFSRILHIVDDYDLLVAGRSNRSAIVSPPEALRLMWPGRGSQYDPTLLVIFAQLLGLYPPGSLIELTDGRWALSVSGGRGKARFGLPVVRIVRSEDGRLRDGTESIDLFEVKNEIRPIRAVSTPPHSIDIPRLLDEAFGG